MSTFRHCLAMAVALAVSAGPGCSPVSPAPAVPGEQSTSPPLIPGSETDGPVITGTAPRLFTLADLRPRPPELRQVEVHGAVSTQPVSPPYSGSEILHLKRTNGRDIEITANQYIAEVNQIERQLNLEGQTLRDPGAAAYLQGKLSYSEPRTTSPAPGGTPARDNVINGFDWNTGWIGQRGVAAAHVEFKQAVSDAFDVSTDSYLEILASFLGQEIRVLRIDASASIPKPVDLVPDGSKPTASVRVAVGGDSSGGGVVFQKAGSSVSYSAPIPPVKLIEKSWPVPIWGPIALKLAGKLSVELVPKVDASASDEHSEVGWSFSLAARAHAEADASLYLLDIGPFLDIDLIRVTPGTRMSADITAPPDVHAAWARTNSFDVSVAGGSIGGTICLDLSFVQLPRICGEVALASWEGAPLAHTSHSDTGRSGKLCSYSCRPGMCGMSSGCNKMPCGCASGQSCDSDSHRCVSDDPGSRCLNSCKKQLEQCDATCADNDPDDVACQRKCGTRLTVCRRACSGLTGPSSPAPGCPPGTSCKPPPTKPCPSGTKDCGDGSCVKPPKACR